jgi:hypothetical protein
VKIDKLEIVSDEPGFTAVVRAGNGPTGPFADYSPPQQVGTRTTIDLAGGTSYRYYLIWIVDPNGRAHINEVRAG